MQFHVHSFRFDFRAIDSVQFPAGKPGNILRGALGSLVRDAACGADCPDARRCPKRRSCAYARLFEPAATGNGPSGLADWPRPFVFRAGHLDGSRVAPGEPFSFGLNLFETRWPALPHFVSAFARLAREGLGAHRGRAELLAVHALDESGEPLRRLAGPAGGNLEDPGTPLALALEPPRERVDRLRVRFLTPTELKHDGKLTARPEFPILFRRVRDRLSTLRALYQDGPIEIDFRELGRVAAGVPMTRCDIEWRSAERRSTRTGQIHPLGGFLGVAEYEGALAPFYPFLHAARWTGVGRHTVWGKGNIDVTVPSPGSGGAPPEPPRTRSR